ncbi:MAG: hypothetical protein AAFR36_21925 [Bacteroidota bacterium]
MTDQEKIERYLANELSPEEQEALEQRLAAEPELRESLSLYRATQEFFQRRNPALEATLEGMGRRYISNTPWYRRWWLAMLLGLVAVGGVYYVWPNLTEPKRQPATMAPVPSPHAPADAPDLAPTDFENKDVLPTSTPSAPLPPESDAAPQAEPSPPASLPPIAQATPADYTPNTDLEELFGTIVRSTDFFVVDSPEAISTLDLAQTSWSLNARTTISKTLELRLYSNASNDFYEDRRISTKVLQATGSSDTLNINQDLPTPEQAGLYYWLVLEQETEEIRAVGKIKVE